ncbi:hypothetical protein SAY86_026630 [Trapa natans]|uniref:AB hydrolase-1 domain-containing protein n=1 Tax=Trapa natans TaxID=22666 RepID=A0AAN7KEB1_TRANT|nr:hypothetical protein SAY86_026630 [Trapa natans]
MASFTRLIPISLLFLPKSLLSALLNLSLRSFPLFVTLMDAFLSIYFRWRCGLCPCTVDLDDGSETTVNFWVPVHRLAGKPILVPVHGYGGNSRWQFLAQAESLSRSFNLFIPDLLFFGKSNTKSADRTADFQASSIVEGLKRMGVERFSVYAISYGGYVGYRMAEKYPESVERIVIVSSGIGCSELQKKEQLKKIGRDPLEILLPWNPRDLRILMDLSMYKYNPFKWVPDFFLWEFIEVMCNDRRVQKSELARHLITGLGDTDLPALTQETLLVWGDQDKVFPVSFAYHLQKQIGPKARVEIIKDTGHAINIESPGLLNDLIKSFILGSL